MRNLSRSTVLFLVSALTAGSAFAITLEPIHRSFAVKPGGHLRLSTDGGGVDVRPGGGDRIDVTIEREARALSQSAAEETFKHLHFDMTQNGNDVEVTAKDDRIRFGGLFGANAQTKFIVLVPDSYELDLHTGGGSINVGNLHGTVQAESGGGDLHLGAIAGHVHARTGGGSINLKQCGADAEMNTGGGSIISGPISGNVNAETGGGDIEIERVGGAVMAHTSGGSIELASFHHVNANTSGGSIEVKLLGQPDAASSLSTSGGSVMLSLQESAHVTIDAATNGGRVSSDIPVTTMEWGSRHESLKGTVNGGGQPVLLRSSGGNIHISKL
jgi:DUF4097 and DUF4098 domain-containing protein YvlB